jgi:hypothetical protein
MRNPLLLDGILYTHLSSTFSSMVLFSSKTSLLFFCVDSLSVDERGVLRSSTINHIYLSTYICIFM